TSASPLPCRGNRREGERGGASLRARATSEDLLHRPRRLRLDTDDVDEHPVDRVPALEKCLQLLGRVPGRVAVQPHVAGVVDERKDVEALQPGILLDVALQSL